MTRRSRTEARRRRHLRIRQKISGTAERPRLAVMVSGRRIYVQFLDDTRGVTLLSACTTRAEGHSIAAAAQLGARVAVLARDKGITRMVVDRGGHRYHGRLRAFVDALVAGGVSKTHAVLTPQTTDGTLAVASSGDKAVDRKAEREGKDKGLEASQRSSSSESSKENA